MNSREIIDPPNKNRIPWSQPLRESAASKGTGMKERTANSGAICCLFIILLWPCLLWAQTTPDPELVAAISGIKVIDNHCHPLKALNEDEQDTEWGDLSYHRTGDANADPGAKMPSLPFRLRRTSPEYVQVWRALYGLPKEGVSKDTLHAVYLAKKKTMKDQELNYPVSVLDKTGIETMLANRVVMDGSLPASRFKWVPYADALMYPLSDKGTLKARPHLAASYGALERLLRTHLTDLQLTDQPRRLEDYLRKVVTPTVENWKRAGAVAVKFQTAYLRTLEISDPSRARAERLYGRYARGGEPNPGDYKILQDYLFRYISREAGRIGLAVHVHTGLGIGIYFNVSGSNPVLLESVLNDPSLSATRFVIIHGGWPVAKETAALLLKPNVYADFSSLGLLIYPRELAGILRSWLEIAPDKVLFGTDGFEVDPKMSLVNWEEFTWIGVQSGKEALALALTDMMHDNEIPRGEAISIARRVLRENAARLYNLNQ